MSNVVSIFRKRTSFLEQCLNGDVDINDIDDFIDSWHESDSTDPLYKYLGLSRNEYALYVEQPFTLPFVIMAHKHNISLDDALSFQDGMALAARAKDADEAHKVTDWLRSTGRIK